MADYDYTTKNSNNFELSMLDLTEDDLDKIPIYYRNGTHYFIDDDEMIYAKSLFSNIGYFIPDSKMLRNLYRQLDISKTEKQIWEEVTVILVKVQGSSTETILQKRFEKALVETKKEIERLISKTGKSGCLKNYNSKCVTSYLSATESRHSKTFCLYCKEHCAKKQLRLQNLNDFKDGVSSRLDCDCVECNFNW
jgi:hypothetical protein